MLQKTVGIVSFLQAERHWWWCCSGESCTLGFDWHLIDIWLTCHHGNRGLTANNMLATRRRWMHVTHRQLHSVSSRSAPADGLFWKSFTSICVTSPVDLIHERSPPEAFWKKVERSDKRRWEKHFSLVGLMQPHTLVLYLKENVGAHNKKNKIYVDTDAQGSVAESTVASIGTDWLVCLGFIRDADNDTHTRNISQHSFSLKKEGEQINEREQIMCRYLHTMMAEMTACWQRCHSGGLCGALGSYLKLCSCQSRPDGPPRTSRPGSEASHTKWKPATCLWFRFNRLPGWTLPLSLCVVIGLK